MKVDLNSEDSPTPPTPERVAARTIALSAVSCRAFIEKDVGREGAEKLRVDVLSWLDRVGVSPELEKREADFLATPLGGLDKKEVIEHMWYCEGLAVLAWALRRSPLPPFHAECDPTAVANAIGFLGEREDTVLQKAKLRDPEEITGWEETYLTLHWRLRQFSLEPVVMDFSDYVSSCNWGPLRLDRIELCEGDLSIDGIRIDRVEESRFRKALSIVQERHRAFNWLAGWEAIYSQVTTGT